MDRAEWARVVGIVYARWPSTDWPTATVAAYYEDMQPYDVEDAIEAVKRLSRREEYAPKLAQLMLELLEVRVEARREREKVLALGDIPWSVRVSEEALQACRNAIARIQLPEDLIPAPEPVTDATDIALFTRVLQGSTIGEPSDTVKEQARYVAYLAAQERHDDLRSKPVRSRRRGRRGQPSGEG